MLVLVLVTALLVVFVLVLSTIQLQEVQHLLQNGLKSSTQVLAAVGFSQWRHMDEGRAALSQVQRRVVGVITQVSGRGQRVVHDCVMFVLSFLLCQIDGEGGVSQ